MSDELDSDIQSESMDDIELAYREAMKSLDEAEMQVGSALMELADSSDDDVDGDEKAYTSIGDVLAEDLAAEAGADRAEALCTQDSTRVSPRAVIEGALFVGGEVALTSRKLASLIGNDAEARLAVRLIDQLNEDYANENRPYEIRLHEGGFRMELREEFANVQARVFGLGPREVRLTPDTLEVLAFVAYNQPVTKEDLTELGQRKTQTIIRQLVRLRLVEVERSGKKKSEVEYRTGDRFLRLFGLDSLDDLPQADVFSFK